MMVIRCDMTDLIYIHNTLYTHHYLVSASSQSIYKISQDLYKIYSRRLNELNTFIQLKSILSFIYDRREIVFTYNILEIHCVIFSSR